MFGYCGRANHRLVSARPFGEGSAAPSSPPPPSPLSAQSEGAAGQLAGQSGAAELTFHRHLLEGPRPRWRVRATAPSDSARQLGAPPLAASSMGQEGRVKLLGVVVPPDCSPEVEACSLLYIYIYYIFYYIYYIFCTGGVQSFS